MSGFPGFVDLQINGYMGVDFSDASLTEASFARACREVLSRGTAAFLPTVITSSRELYRRNLPLMAHCMDMQEFRGRLLGFHLEGPFLSRAPGAKGAHNSDLMTDPDIACLDELVQLADGKIKLMTVAAELPGTVEFIKYAVSKGITVSLGHQMAMADSLQKGADAGAKSITHLGNGLPGTLPRHPNPLWDALACDDLSGMIITDGHHLPPSVIKTVIRTKGIDKTVVVSDASPIAGMPPGNYRTLGTDAVLEPDGRIRSIDGGHLVGSSRNMLECMNYLASLNITDENGLLKIGFHNPLKLIGMSESAMVKSENRVVFTNGKFIAE